MKTSAFVLLLFVGVPLFACTAETPVVSVSKPKAAVPSHTTAKPTPAALTKTPAPASTGSTLDPDGVQSRAPRAPRRASPMLPAHLFM